MSDLKERLKLLRKDYLDLTLEELGTSIGVSKQSISMMERGDSSITPRTIRLICEKYNVNEEWLADGVGEVFKDLDRETELMQFVNKMTNLDESDLKRRFFEALVQLPDEDIEYFAKLVKKLANKL